jgi:hypothetical protein
MHRGRDYVKGKMAKIGNSGQIFCHSLEVFGAANMTGNRRSGYN